MARVRVRKRSRHWYRRRNRRRLTLALTVVGGFGLLAAVQLFWAVTQMQGVQRHLEAAEVALRVGDLDRARSEVDEANGFADRAAWGTAGPHLWLAQQLPLVGDDVRSVRAVTQVSGELTGPLADDLFQLRTTLDPEQIRPHDGQVDLALFELARDQIQVAGADIAELDARLDFLDEADLLGPLGDRVHRFADEVDGLRALTEYGDGVLEMMPRLLGAEGSRRYVVVFQNNAELRSTGGIPTAFAVVEADRGRLSMRDQGTVPEFGGVHEKPVLPETAEERFLFDRKLAKYMPNANLTPHWPRTGALLQQMWLDKTGEKVDGVLSVDPVALSYVLRGTGPVQLRDGKVARSDNAVQLLLNQTYFDYAGQAAQNDFFEDSARRIFDFLVRGEGDAGTALRGVYDGVREGRGLAWLSDPAEQQRLSGGIVAGELRGDLSGEARGEAEERPDIGVFLNDSTATKLDFYVSSQTDITREECLDNGGQVLQVTTTLRSRVPDAVDTFPELLIGFRPAGRVGDLLTTVMAYGPVGSTIEDPTIDGRVGAPSYAELQGHPVVSRTVLLEPGEAIRLTWRIRTRPGQGGAPVLRTTPGAHTAGVGGVERAGCHD